MVSGTITENTIPYIPDKIEKNTYLEVLIQSYGGDGSVATGYFDVLRKRAKQQKIITIGVGVVQSSAMWVFLAGDERWAYKHTNFMFHDGRLGDKTKESLKNFIKFCEKNIWNTIIKRVVDISNKKDRKFWNNLFFGKEIHLNAYDMKKLGLVTKIL